MTIEQLKKEIMINEKEKDVLIENDKINFIIYYKK